MSLNKPGLRVAVVGATGMVGRELVSLLEKHRFPISQLLPFSSGKSRSFVRFKSRSIPSVAVDKEKLASCGIVFFVSSEEVSREYAPELARRGVWVIDDSSEFRLDPKVPLVIPEVNAHALTPKTRLIAGPNCTMTGLAVAGWPLHRQIPIQEVRVSSYQAVSGAGRSALNEFFLQTKRLLPRLRLLPDGRAPILPEALSQALPQPIAANVFPQVGRFDEHGHSGEETKVCAELKKIWGLPRLKVSVTAVRVPVVRGHSLAVWLTFQKPLLPRQAKILLQSQGGLKLLPGERYPTPLGTAGTEPVMVGRLRQGISQKELCLWIVSDNLLKGAALNSLQIAQYLLKKGWLLP